MIRFSTLFFFSSSFSEGSGQFFGSRIPNCSFFASCSAFLKASCFS